MRPMTTYSSVTWEPGKNGQPVGRSHRESRDPAETNALRKRSSSGYRVIADGKEGPFATAGYNMMTSQKMGSEQISQALRATHSCLLCPARTPVLPVQSSELSTQSTSFIQGDPSPHPSMQPRGFPRAFPRAQGGLWFGGWARGMEGEQSKGLFGFKVSLARRIKSAPSRFPCLGWCWFQILTQAAGNKPGGTVEARPHPIPDGSCCSLRGGWRPQHRSQAFGRATRVRQPTA